MPKKTRGGKKNRKHGRWLRKPSYKRYLAEHRWARNKARKIKRMMRRHPDWKWSWFPNLSDEVKRYLT